MKLDFKVIFLGGLAFYATMFLLSMATGGLIHEGVLLEPYMANASFWRPELNQDPPDMAALFPLWITTGLIATFIQTAIFDNIRSALNGSVMIQGVKFGAIAFLFYACASAGWSGIFNLPYEIWIWWGVEAALMYLVGGAVLGFVTGKIAST